MAKVYTPIRGLPGDGKVIAVTGSGRTGLVFTSRILTSFIGLKVGHEAFWENGIASFYLSEEKRYEYFKDVTKDCDLYVLHQLRDPMRAISSMINRDYLTKIHRIIPEIDKDDSLLIKSAKFYYYWNKLIEEKFDVKLRYKIEDLNSATELRKFCMAIDVKYSNDLLKQVKSLGTSINTSYIPSGKIKRPNRKDYHIIYTLEDLEKADKDTAKLILDIGTEYGYYGSKKVKTEPVKTDEPKPKVVKQEVSETKTVKSIDEKPKKKRTRKKKKK